MAIHDASDDGFYNSETANIQQKQEAIPGFHLFNSTKFPACFQIRGAQSYQSTGVHVWPLTTSIVFLLQGHPRT